MRRSLQQRSMNSGMIVQQVKVILKNPERTFGTKNSLHQLVKARWPIYTIFPQVRTLPASSSIPALVSPSM